MLDDDYDSVLRMEDIVETIYINEDGAGILGLGGIEDVRIGAGSEIRQNRSIAIGRELLYRSYMSVVVCYLWCDVAGTEKVVIFMLRIGLAYYPEPKEGDGTSQRYQDLSYKGMSYHYDLLTTTTVAKRSK